MSVLRSGVLAILDRLIQLAVGLAALIILSRLVSPTDFGLYGIAYGIMMLLSPVQALGLVDAYVRRDEVGPEIDSAFFAVNLAFGVVSMVMILLLALVVPLLYGEPALLSIIAVSSLTILAQALSRQPIATLRREKRFGAFLIISQLGAVGGLIVSVVMALLGFGVWALIWRPISQAIGKLVLLWGYLKPSYRWVGLGGIRAIGDSIRLGTEVTLVRVLNGIQDGVDKLIAGKLFGLAPLGHYTRGQQLGIFSGENLAMGITSAALSYIARLDDAARPRAYALLVFATFSVIAVPGLLLVLYGEQLVLWLLGDKWALAARLAPWFGLWALGRSFYKLGLTLSVDQKRVARWSLITAIAPFLTLLPATLAGVLAGIEPFVALLATTTTLYWSGALSLLLHGVGGWALVGQLVRSVAGASIGGLLAGIAVVDRLDLGSIPLAGFIEILLVAAAVGLGVLLGQLIFNAKQLRATTKVLLKR